VPTASKKAKYCEKKFWHQLSLKKGKFCEIWRQIWQPWGVEAACTLFFICLPVSDDNDSSAPEVKIPPCLHMWCWIAWSVEFCMRW